MKKPILLLMTLLLVAGANAQLRFIEAEYDRNYPEYGYTNIALNEDSTENAFRFTFDLVDVAVGSRPTSNSNVRSVGGVGFYEDGSAPAAMSNNTRFQNGRTTAVQAGYYNDLAQFIKAVQDSSDIGGGALRDVDGYSNLILDVPGSDVEGDKAITVWPGVGAVGNVMLMYYGFDGLSLKSDISFDLTTLDPGTMDKTVNVKCIVQARSTTVDWIHVSNGMEKVGMSELFSQVTSENVSEVLGDNYYVIDNVYTSATSGAGRKTINLAEELGVEYGLFSNANAVTIYLFTKYDGPTSFDAYYPIIGLDNLAVEYGYPKWIEPAVGANEEYAFDPIEVYAGIEADYKVVFKDQGRLGAITMTTDNEVVNIYSIKSVFANDGEGNYTKEIEGVTIVNNEGNYTLTIPAPTEGAVDDDIEVTLGVSIPRAAVVGGYRTYRLEVTNGIRFYADFKANIVAAPVEWVEPAVGEGETDATGFELPLGNHKTPVTFKLIDINRWDNLVISTANETEVEGFYFEQEDAITSNDGSVEYDFVYDEDTKAYTLTIAYPEGELADDDLEVTMYAALDSDDTSLIGEKITYRLALDNGILIYKELVATVIADVTSIEGKTTSDIRLTTYSGAIIVENAEDDVVVINATGQIIKSVPAAEAARGIALENGVYIVKSGAYVQKALVK